MEKGLNITVMGGIIQWSCWQSYITKEGRKGREGNGEKNVKMERK
jgi:hypothetical protein